MPQNVYLYNPDAPVPKNVQQVRIPEGISFIRNNAFESCSALQSVTIPEGVTEIGDYAFFRCSELQSVAIPDSVTKIGSGAFSHCSALQSVTMPNSVTRIEEEAFFGCHALQSVTIPDGVTEIGSWAFAACPSLQLITIPESVTMVSNYTFLNCRGLKSVTIPNNVTEIGDGAFEYCSVLQSVTIPDSVTKIGNCAFRCCSGLQSIAIPDGVTEIGDSAFGKCSGLQSLTYKGVDIAPFINIDGYRVNTFDVIKALVERHIPLSEHTVRNGVHYPVFGEMRFSANAGFTDPVTEKRLWQCFAEQKRTEGHIPEILDKLIITIHICGIPPERIAATFDIGYTDRLLREEIPIVPAEACRCYYNRDICDALIQRGQISVMAEAIGLYNKSEHLECYRHLMDFILSHPDTRIEDLQYAVDHAKEIPMKAGTMLTQVRQHRTYMENLAEVEKIEAEYGKTVPGFKVSDYQCNIEPVSVTYDGMTARVLDLTDHKDTALATRLGELTDCDMRLGYAGETAMMHGFLNSDAGFWVMEDGDGTVLAQARIEKADSDTLAFDFIELAGTNLESASEKAGRIRGAIAVWATESGYKNIIMECGYNGNLTEAMEPAPAPKLCLTPEEVFAMQKGNDAEVSFRNIDEARQYMQTEQYSPDDFVHTGMTGRCVYIKKDGRVADYLMQNHNVGLTDRRFLSESKTATEQGIDTDYR